MTSLHALKSGLGIGALCVALALPATALADNLSVEITTAAEHAGFSAASPTLDQAHTHLHHTLNCLVGPGGNGFDTKALNPCKGNGNGAIPDATDAKVKAALEAIAQEDRAALASNDFAKVKKDAADIQAKLKALKTQ